MLVDELLGIVLEIGLHLGKKPSKSIFLASVLSGYLELGLTRLVDYILELSILVLQRSSLTNKSSVLGLK